MISMKVMCKLKEKSVAWGRHNTVSLFIRKVKNLIFLDLYFISPNKEIHRFVIREGYRFPKDDEILFLSLLPGLIICNDACERLQKVTTSHFPTWSSIQNKIPDYFVPAHVYFTSHRSGPREILYKAGLTNLACNFDRFESCNIFGKNPEEIFGHGLTVKALRIMNNLMDLEFYDEYLDKFAETYHRFSDHIGNTMPTDNQIKYLMSICTEGTVFSRLGFNRTLYNTLQTESDIFEYYRKYYEMIEKHPELKTRFLPQYGAIFQTDKELERVIKNTENIQKKYKKRWIEEHKNFEFSNDKFEIIMPKSAWDVYKESIRQHNCLMTFIDEHSYNGTTILFLRRKSEPNKNFVTVELCNNRIKQIKAACNETPSDEVFEFILDYIEAKGLSLVEDPDWHGEDDGIDEELLKYIDRKNDKAA